MAKNCFAAGCDTGNPCFSKKSNALEKEKLSLFSAAKVKLCLFYLELKNVLFNK